MKQAKRLLALFLALVMFMGMDMLPTLASGTESGADQSGTGSLTVHEIESQGQKGDPSKTINLTEEGNVAWRYFAVGGTNNDEQKRGITSEITVSGESERKGSTADGILHFLFTDGEDTKRANNQDSYTTEEHGAIYRGVGSGFSVSVPGSTKQKTLKIYLNDYKAAFKAEVFLNNELKATKTFDNNGETNMPMLSVDYQTGAEETLTVKFTITAMYDQNWGSVGLHAITVHEEIGSSEVPEPEVILYDIAVPEARIINLTEEGTGYWKYVAVGESVSDVEKRQVSSLAAVTEERMKQGNTRDRLLAFRYSDGNGPQNNDGTYETEWRGRVYKGVGAGFTVKVPGSTEARTLRLYLGDYKAKFTVEVLRNGEKEGEKTFDNPGATNMPVFKMDYCTAPDDVLELKVTVTDNHGDVHGSISLHAITVTGEPVARVEKVTGGLKRVTNTVNDPLKLNLTEEGNVDWVYFNGSAPEDVDRRRMFERFITDIQGVGDRNYSLSNDKAPFLYTFNNGTYVYEATDLQAHPFLMNKVGTGVKFRVPGGPEKRQLKIYCGAWAADATLTVKVNGEEEFSGQFGKTTTDSGAYYYLADLTYHTESAGDIVEVECKVIKHYSQNWSNISLEAVTLHMDNPPEVTTPDYTQEYLKNDMIDVSHPDGAIRTLKLKEADGNWLDIPFRGTASSSGPAWQVNGEFLRLKKIDDGKHQSYSVTKDGITYGLAYSASQDGTLNVQATLKNESAAPFQPDRASLVVGLNTYMADKYDDYKKLFFPTLLRCEKNYLWGYFQSPLDKVLTMTVDAPVSSYRLDYESGLHRIYTAKLDLMQKDAVNRPARHPDSQNDTLPAGETRTWNVKLKLSDSVEDVQADVAKMVEAPVISADRYTLGKDESAHITVRPTGSIDEIVVDKLDNGNAPNTRSKDGEKDTFTTTYTPCSPLPLTKNGDGTYSADFTPAKGAGVYRLRVTGENGLISEAMITQRNTWGWYMKNAMLQGVSHPQRGGYNCESWYGAYSVYLGQKYFDLSEASGGKTSFEEFDRNFFRDVYDVLEYEDENGNPRDPNTNPDRIQNHSTTLGQLVDRYEATGDLESLKKAVPIADLLLRSQDARGAYIGPHNVDYTGVIYPAKSIMELMYYEEKLAETDTENSQFWKENYDKQYTSVKKAMDHLINLAGDLHTEGQSTFEDGAYSCTVTQLSEFALLARDRGDEDWAKYKDSAEDYLRKHEALEQQLIPDSRINGGSLRFWEAQYDTLIGATPNNMMNSPHGWTAWNIYGLFNLYQLTGNQNYLERGMNAMGSCAQLMGFDGNLYWAFITDPYIQARLKVQKPGDTSKLGQAITRNVTMGENYVDMITDWFLSEPGTIVGAYWGQGGSCDNDVHEIFKALEECALTKAYVVENAGGYTTYGCTAVEKNGVLTITADSEELTSEINLNLLSNKKYSVTFSNGKSAQGTAPKGLSWVREGEDSEPPVEDEVVEQARQAAKAAKEAAEAAEKAAGNAADAKSVAEKSAQAAQAAQENAKKAAQTAGENSAAAVQAKNAAVEAQGKAETAKKLAVDAQTAAEKSAQAAADAQTAAEEAKNGAEGALKKAETARDAALQAQQSAEQSKDAAEKSAESAEEYANLAIAAKDVAVAAKEEALKAQEAAERAQKIAEEKAAEAERAIQEAQRLKKEMEDVLARVRFENTRVTVKTVKSSKKGQVKISWKKVEGAEGYVIQYATKASFKGKKTVTVKSGKATGRTIRKLKRGRKYYFRIRAYRMADGERIYTSFSAKKIVKKVK